MLDENDTTVFSENEFQKYWKEKKDKYEWESFRREG